MFLSRLVIVFLTILVCSTNLGHSATLHPDEVDALREIGRTLRKTWDFSVDPCSREGNWTTPIPNNAPKGYENTVNCSCTFENNTVCRVVGIMLKSQSLQGTIPRELVRLPFLQTIDLTRNYLNGTIPREWGTFEQLEIISLLGNRITGTIPGELANISTLTELVLEHNHLSGNIPPEFGDFSNISRILLTSNNLTGALPSTLAKLTTLTDFRISDNKFSGSIPNFIENWTRLEKLLIQASGLSGPIPSGIASLTKLSDVRITDLKGNDSTFPPLSDNTNLKRLILRSCNLIGQIPSFVGELTKLKDLDLSFNKLSGPIPVSFGGLSKADHIYLTGNSLTGDVPAWMPTVGNAIDLSYNNLTPKSIPSDCQRSRLNLFESSKGNTTGGSTPCLRSLRCEKKYYSLHINCGGKEVKVDDDKGTTYEVDVEYGGPSTFIQMTNWAFSSTGDFLDNDNPDDSYISRTISSISEQNPELYMDARISPLSLTYYGFCLANGNYTVKLHFAEIIFTDNRTYTSLGRRIFDVYVQGKLVLEDFNIEDEAGGANKAVLKNFTAVVTDNTLEIRLYWAGKGTSAIPDRGVYGPLISAISVDADFPVPSENGNSLTTGAIVGIVIAVLFIFLILGILWWKGCLGSRDTTRQDLKGLDLHTASFTLRQIKAATNNFHPDNKIGEGGFGPVYKGVLLDGTIIAVKQLSAKSKQGNREFVNEIGMISALQHPHLVKLHGCCIEGNQLLLVYEYMENNSLARALFGPEEQQLKLDWPTRHKICIGIARGLAYLHEESRLKIVHRDIKATNVLLDKNLNPKISDFGLAKLDEEDNTHISTRIAGTFGYMAPEYAMRGHLTDKADVYSFGVVLLEIVSGRSNTSVRPKADTIYLLDLANSLNAKGNLMELVDPRLGSNFNKKEVITTINVALRCADVTAAERPSMSAVVSILEGRGRVSMDDLKPKELSIGDQVTKSNDDQIQSISTDVPWTASSTETDDLYPLTIDTDYWEKRM